jgi:hypothetical protein
MEKETATATSDGLSNRSWSFDEFAGVDFNDERLNQRLLNLMTSLSEYPLSPINQACHDKAEVKAAYRFFSNPKILVKEILRVHQRQVCQRAAEKETVYVIQDTSFIDYTSHLKTEGLGKLSNYRKNQNKGKGLVMHSSLLLDENGLSLGVLDQKIWSRALTPNYERNKELYKIPIEKKESYRWLEGIKKSIELLKKGRIKPQSIVHIADREADMFEFMECALNEKAHFIVRGDNKFRTIVREGHKINYRTGEAIFTTLDAFKKSPIKGDLWIEVPKRPSHTNSVGAPERIAEVEIRACHIKLPPPKHLFQLRRKNSQSGKKSFQEAFDACIEVNVVWVKELNPPPEIDALEWFIYTDLKVESIEDAEKIVSTYKLRWQIELFHKILKSGCHVEECRLGTAERLEKYLTIFSIIAWRILWMTHLNRQQPDLASNSFLTENEWKALYCRTYKTNIPSKEPPSVHEAIHWIARLGGFLDRKSDGEPGMITIWRGWQRLSDIALDWRIFHSNERYGE